MPESIEWPPLRTGRPPRPPNRRRVLLIFVVLAVIFFGTRTALSYYVDTLWFGSLGYGEVFWKHSACNGEPSRRSRRQHL